MKFALNGGLILGTLDGANIEIREEIGADNMFIFGLEAHEVPLIRTHGERPIDERLYDVLLSLAHGTFGPYQLFKPVIEPLWRGNDHYLLGEDFASYLKAQKLVDDTFCNKQKWAQMTILSTAGMGKFSSDRAIMEYAKDIWNVKQCELKDPFL
eukprot:TRINITY_DN2717_c0_g1_i1.p2 TRINITY_DN2717_c0_g1~~TRINITY_DN2717_c0_g1_i1.p2  ORF type:complete len:154 (+),score=52.89 TRINITY_DN2717_c0_g1_i1:478-939(+)